MRKSILHVSDLHIGARRGLEAENMAAELGSLAERVAPELVIASGDLTHRGRTVEHAAAATLLRGLGCDLLVVPGNHDIPYTLPARFTSPWNRFEGEWETTEPFYSSATACVVGLNSVRPTHQQSGKLRAVQLTEAASKLATAMPGALRVVAFHHQLLGSPWRGRKKPVANRGMVLDRLANAGAELIVGGHIHQAAVSERREFDVTAGERDGVVLAIAPGFGRPRPNRSGEARGANVYSADESTIVVETYLWRDGDWALGATRSFARVRKPEIAGD